MNNQRFAEDWAETGKETGFSSQTDHKSLNASDLPEIYYDGARQVYWVCDRRGNWIMLNETGAKRYLKSEGFSAQRIEGEPLSALDAAVLEINRSNHVNYAGGLAGYAVGVHEVVGFRVLVTSSPRLIEPKEGDWPTINQLLVGMFEDDEHNQSVYLLGWLKCALECLYAQQRRPGQALVIAGPAGCGKSLLQQLITEMFGGRSAKPFQFMVGRTDFNSHLFAAEHLVIEDEAASTDIRTRREFGSHLKELTVNDQQSCHAKNRTPVMLTPQWRLTISVNEEPENLMVLPPIDESLRDKIILLKAHKNPLPVTIKTPNDRERFFKTLCAELPAFVHFLLGLDIQADLESDRYGVKHFQHPDLLRAIEELAPHQRLLSIIDSCGLFHGPDADPWTGRAEELERKLREANSGAFNREVDRLFTFATACGVYLGRLATACPDRVKKTLIQGCARWTIQPPQGGG